MSVEERVISVVRENLEDGKEVAITADSELVRDLEVDSVSALTILFGLEKEFSVSLHESTFASCKTVHDVVASLEEKLPQLGGA
jgi:acyl carrier protein